jgi:hypothetical protein
MGVAAVAATNSSTPVTFNKDVLPILQKNCQNCHRPGEAVPMSLLSYNEARPWAKAMKSAVVTRKMPPWFAEAKYGHFKDERILTAGEISTLSSWADNGAPEGDAKDKPAPLKFHEGWNIQPDIVVEMPTAFPVPATGTIEYQYIVVKGNFKEDLWVKEAEMRAGDPNVVHHMKAWVRPPGSHWMATAMPGVAYTAPAPPSGTSGVSTGAQQEKNDMSEGNDILGKYNTGLGAQSFDVDGSAKFIPKGSDIVFEIHYTATGKATSDKSKLGLVLAKHAPATRYFTSYGPNAFNLVIPSGDGNAEVVSELTVGTPAKLVYVQPHMHLRGKDYELRLIYPTGESETVFRGKFDFNWQLGYDFVKPIVLPKGTRLVGISHFDNSVNNPFNPDATKQIRWGFQNWEEMSNCFMGLVVDLKTDPAKVFYPSGPSLLPAGKSGPTLAALQASK